MVFPEQVLELENRSLGAFGEPTLPEAYEILNWLWEEGSRDREIALHLMFISWYGIVEPKHITGFEMDDETQRRLNESLKSVHQFCTMPNYFRPTFFEDPEMLYAFGLAAHLFWYMLDNATQWKKVAAQYRSIIRKLAPKGLDPSIYDNRGAYGAYYAMQVQVADGY